MKTVMVICPKCNSDTPAPGEACYYDWGYSDSGESEPRKICCIWCGEQFDAICERDCIGVEVR